MESAPTLHFLRPRRCAFPLNELRFSGTVQGGLIALGLALALRHGAAPAKVWPYLLMGYGVLASVFPWCIGGFLEEEFEVRYALLLGLLTALPLVPAARWLGPTPYQALVVACWVLLALRGLHLLVAVGKWALRTRRVPPQPRQPRGQAGRG